MRRRKTGGSKLKKPVKILFIIVTVSFIIIQIISAVQLRSISQSTISSPKSKTPNNSGAKIDKFGETVIKMLPEDLAFTLFLPSERAIERDLRLDRNDSNSYAILTRILGFSAVPRWIRSGDLEDGKQKMYDSISGLSLYMWKDVNEEAVVVNGVVSEEVDLRMGKVVVHVMDGVVMDAEFEQSLHDDDDEDVHDGEKFS